MGAHIDIEFFAIYQSKNDLESAIEKCKEFRKEIDFISIQEEDFFKLSDNYLLFNIKGVNVTYSDSISLPDYFEVLAFESIFSQVVLISEELEIDTINNYRKYDTEKFEEIKIVKSYENKTKFSQYFEVPESRKKFECLNREDLFFDTKKVEINNQEYIYFEVSQENLFFNNFPFNELLLSIEEHFYVTFDSYKQRTILNRKLENQIKEQFISDDPSKQRRSFFYGEYDNRVFCVEHQGKKTITIGNKKYKDCLKLKHGALYWHDTTEMKTEGIEQDLNWIENYIETYWSKDNGLIRIILEKGNVIYDCISTDQYFNFNQEIEILNSKKEESTLKRKKWWEFWK